MARTTNRTEAEEKLGRARRLVAARKAAGFTQKEAALKTGIKFDTLRAHESGRNGYAPSDASVYAKTYGSSEQHLLYDRSNIFISHSHSDSSIVSELAHEMEKLGPKDREAWSEVFVKALRVAKGQ